MSDTTEGIERALVAWEGAARAATPGPWTVSSQYGRVDVFQHPYNPGDEMIAVEVDAYDAAHIALNDPAAVIRMVAGIRAVVALHTRETWKPNCSPPATYTADRCPGCGSGNDPCRTITTLAAMFAPAAEGDAGVGS